MNGIKLHFYKNNICVDVKYVFVDEICYETFNIKNYDRVIVCFTSELSDPNNYNIGDSNVTVKLKFVGNRFCKTVTMSSQDELQQISIDNYKEMNVSFCCETYF